MRVLVTGGSGFLGATVAELLVSRGEAVRGLVRRSSDTTKLAALGVELCVANLHPAHRLHEALDGVDAVIHCAGGGYARQAAEVYANNLETTRALLEASLQVSSLKRLVFVSSLAAHGPCPSGTPRDPDSRPTPVSHYGRAKAQAEEQVLQHGQRLHVTIFRPPAIYGPGDTRMLSLFRWVRRGLMPVPASARSSSFVHVRDCARALVASLFSDHPSGRRYFVDDGEPLSYEQLGALIGSAVGREPRLLRVPGWSLRSVGLAAELLAFLSRRPSLMSRGKAEALLQPHWLSRSDRLRAELGWEAEFRFEEGAREMAAWYRGRGWLR